MTWPTISLDAGFGANPWAFVGATWTDVASYVQRLTIKSPSRARLIDTFSAGSVTAVLDNSDRRFDPTNLSGPYVSGGRSLVVPNLPLRGMANYGGSDYPLGVWFKDSGKVTWSDPSWSETEWTGTDAFKLLGRAPIVPTALAGSEELSSDRATRILDHAGWPSTSGYRYILTGLSRMQATTHEASPLAEIQLVAASEGGEVWCTPEGEIGFHNRSYRTSSTSWTFSDASGTQDYTDLVLMDDEDQIINYASITRVGGTAQVAEDTTSQTRYGPSSTSAWQRTDLVMLDDTEADAIARMAVDVYADSAVRFSAMTIDPTVNDDLWAFIFGMRLGHRLTITRTPPGGGSAITRTCFLEGWTHDIVPGNGGTQGVWTTTLLLGDVQDSWDRSFFVLDSSALDGSDELIW